MPDITHQQRITGGAMMRDGALGLLTDDDLTFTPGGDNVTLGELLRAHGEIQHTYTQSFETRTHDWSYRSEDPALAVDIERLKTWFAQLDRAMLAAVDALAEADFSAEIDRGDVVRTVAQQLEIYSQTQLIFLGKLTIYLKALGKTLPQSIQHYID